MSDRPTRFGSARASALGRRRLDVEVEPVGGNVQLVRRLGTDERDPIVPDDPGIGSTYPDEATLVGTEFPEAPGGQPGGAGVKGPPCGEDETFAGTSTAPRVPGCRSAGRDRTSSRRCSPGPGQGISRPSLSVRREPSGPTPVWPRRYRDPSGRRSRYWQTDRSVEFPTPSGPLRKRRGTHRALDRTASQSALHRH